MNTVTLVSEKVKNSFAGRKVNMPVLGEVTFEKDGSLVVDDDDNLEEFLKDTEPSFAFRDKSKKVTKETAGKEGNGKTSDPEYLFKEEDLANLNTEDLLELAKEAGLGEKAAGWTDGKIRKELLKKIK